MGALLGFVLPALQTGAWLLLVGMAAVLSGAIGCPLTAAVLALELTHNFGLLLPVLVGSVAAHALTVLFCEALHPHRRRLSRRGHHLSREYSVDPLEVILVSEVMRTRVVVLPAELNAEDKQQWLEARPRPQSRPRTAPLSSHRRGGPARGSENTQRTCCPGGRKTSQMPRTPLAAPVVAYPGETLRCRCRAAWPCITSSLFPCVRESTRVNC